MTCKIVFLRDTLLSSWWHGENAKADYVSLSLLMISEHFKTSNQMFSVHHKCKTGAQFVIRSVCHRKFLLGWSKEPFSPLVMWVIQFLFSIVIFARYKTKHKMPCMLRLPVLYPAVHKWKPASLIPSVRFMIPIQFLKIDTVWEIFLWERSLGS